MDDHCLYCDKRLIPVMSWRRLFVPEEEPLLCSECLGKLDRIEGPTCQICGRPLEKLNTSFIQNQTCHDCIRWEEQSEWHGVLDRNTSTWMYNDFLKEIIAQFKFRGDYELVKAFALEARSAIQTLEFDYAAVIPLSEERLNERGFNQSQALADHAGIKTVSLLQRMDSEKQSKKTRLERIRQGTVFQLAADKVQLAGKTILLIDDIYTTGTTIRHAAKVLKQRGARSIISYTLVRG